MTLDSIKKSSLRKAVLPASVLGMLLMMSGSAAAFHIDNDNSDLNISWDNTVRYNLGVRAENCDQNICGNGAGAGDITAHQSDRKFAKSGDIVTNRVDLLSEFDVIYKKNSGLRVSAAAWYDAAYKNKIEGDPALNLAPGSVGQGAGPVGSRYTNYAKRYDIGPSGEILDAFVFAKVDLGSVPVNVKLGQHNVYWGESLFSFVSGVAYNQGHVDIRKAFANPGIDAKEVFKPLNQFSFSAQPAPGLTLIGQYFFDWKYSPLPDGGTYFGAADGLSMGGGGTIFGAATSVSAIPKNKRGDFGLGAKWAPEWLNGTAGFYYREFTNKFPQLVLNSFMIIPGVGAAPTAFGLDYSSAKREKLYGFSLAKQMAGISWGMDVTYRPDAVLMATPFSVYVPSGTNPSSWVPTGDVWTGVVNGIALFKTTPLFDMAALTAEVNYSRLDKVTANQANFSGQGYGCADSANPTYHACPTKDAWGMGVMFNPTWFQVWQGVDVSMPLFYSVGLKGNSPVIFGDNKGQGSWSVGISADVAAKYNFVLKYNGFNARHRNDQLGVGGDNNSSLGKFWDRGWLSLTFKTSF